MSSTSSKELMDRGPRGLLTLGFHLKGQNNNRNRSASSSAYEESIADREEFQKENIAPRPGAAPYSAEKRKDSLAPASKSLFGSGLPTLRRTRSNVNRHSPSPPVLQGTRWDEFRGEPTSAPGGKSAQVGASTFHRPFGFPENSKFGVEVSISGGSDKPKKSTFAERAAKFGRDALPEVRPPWKGASGRSAIVDPVRNTAQPPPPQRNVYSATKNSKELPRKENDFNARIGSKESLSDASRAKCLTPTVREQLAVKDKSPALSGMQTSQASEKQTLNPPAPAVSETRPAYHTVSPQLAPISSKPITIISDFDDYISRSSIDSDDSTVTVGGRDAQQPRSHFSWSTYSSADDTEEEDEEGESEFGDKEAQHMASRPTTYAERELVSRFSWTTVTTDTTYQHSPPPSPPFEARSPPSPIMMRRRPVPSQSVVAAMLSQAKKGGWDGGAIEKTRASTTSIHVKEDQARNKSSIHVNTDQTTRDKPSITSSPASAVDKALPLPPTMDKESTRIESLQAKSDELDLRQSNLQRVITELQKLDQASPLEVTLRMRKENTKKLDQVRTALEEVQRERHEVGTALARARIRAEKEEGDGSSLWLRRVTG